jgi:hypothetical protein
MGVKGKRFSGRSFFDRSFFGLSWGKGRSGSKLRASAKAVVPLISVFALAACSIRPTGKDVTGLPIVAIVNHIRCETRIAIQLKAIDELKVSRDGPSLLTNRMEAALGQVWDANVVIPTRDLSPKEFALFKRYIQTGIAFGFTLESSEENKAALAADPVRLITNGMAGINLSSSGDFVRDNNRTFLVSETFERLLSNTIPKCESGELLPENFAYPVAGSIGMTEMIATFIDLNEDDPLQLPASSGGSDTSSSKPASTTPPAGSSKTKGTGSPATGSGVFADTVTFTTTLMGGVTPTVQINPVGHKWGLASPTSFAATVTRTDKHMLNIGLSKATSGEIAQIGIGPVTFIPLSGSQARSSLQKSPGRISSGAEQRALDAITQQRIDNFFNRGTVVVPAQ